MLAAKSIVAESVQVIHLNVVGNNVDPDVAVLICRARSNDFTLLTTYVIITKTRLYNFDPLKPHFYIVKLGVYRGVHYFPYFCSKT